MQNFVNCDVCKKPISAKSYQSHLLGKKHKEMQEILTRRRHIEETGLYIKGTVFSLEKKLQIHLILLLL